MTTIAIPSPDTTAGRSVPPPQGPMVPSSRRPTALLLATLATVGWLLATGPATAAPYGREPGVGKPEDVPKLVAVLQNKDATPFEKARACQQLAVVGQREAVAPLAALLADPILATQARSALESMPDPAAAEALVSALASLQGPFLVGAVNSLGVRRDPRAVNELARLVRDPLKGAGAPSLVALGRIGTPEAVAIVREFLGSASAELRAAAAEGCILAAELALARNEPVPAAALYDAARRVEVPQPLRLAATRGAILARPGQGLALLVEQLRSEDRAFRALAASLVGVIPGDDVLRVVGEELPRSKPDVQIVLLRALADRGAKGLAGTVEALAGVDSAEVRVAGLEALGRLGEASSVPTLLQALGSGRPAESEAAASSLVRLASPGIEPAILQALPAASVELRTRLATILGNRGAKGATGELLKLAADEDPGVGKAAFDALAIVAEPADLPRLIRVATQRSDPGVRDRAERTLYFVSLKNPRAANRSDDLAAAFREAGNADAKRSLLQVMSMLADATAYRTVADAYRDADPTVRDAALRLLANWPDATPAPLLLEVVQSTSNDVHRTLALRGVVTLATLWKSESPSGPAGARRPPAEAIDWLTRANALVRPQADEKKILLSGLGDLNCAEGLRLLGPYLDDPAIATEAAQAVLRASKGLATPADKAAAKPLLEKVLASTQDTDLRTQARKALDGL